MADYRAHDSKGKGHHGTGMPSMRQKIGGHHGKWKGHDGNCCRCRRVIRGLVHPYLSVCSLISMICCVKAC